MCRRDGKLDGARHHLEAFALVLLNEFLGVEGDNLRSDSGGKAGGVKTLNGSYASQYEAASWPMALSAPMPVNTARREEAAMRHRMEKPRKHFRQEAATERQEAVLGVIRGLPAPAFADWTA